MKNFWNLNGNLRRMKERISITEDKIGKKKKRDALFKENVNLNNCGHKIATKSGIL